MSKVRMKNVSEIEGLEAFKNYIIMSDGKCFNTKHNRQIGSYTKEYPHVTLSAIDEVGNQINKTIDIHRLVALAFIPNPDNKPEVDHIISDKLYEKYNDYSNLRWVTREENIGNINYERRKKSGQQKRPVIVFNKNDKTSQYYESLSAACKATNVNYSVAYAILSNKKKYSKDGYKFICVA